MSSLARNCFCALVASLICAGCGGSVSGILADSGDVASTADTSSPSPVVCYVAGYFVEAGSGTVGPGCDVACADYDASPFALECVTYSCWGIGESMDLISYPPKCASDASDADAASDAVDADGDSDSQ